MSGRLNALQFSAGRDPDQNCDLAVQLAKPGSLQLFDMGYAVLDRLRRIGEQEAFYLTPLKTHTNVYAQPDDAEPLDLARWLDQQEQKGHFVDQWVYVGAQDRLPVRLVAYRLSQQQTERRRRQARQNAKKKKRTVSPKHLQLLAWGLMITNIPTSMVSAEALRTLYRVRWQIELFFKLCKSQFQLAAVRAWRLPRLLCQLYARLIGVVFFQWLIVPWRFWNQRELSPPKAARILRRQTLAIVKALRAADGSLDDILADIHDDFLRYALKSPRKKSPSTFTLLAQLDGQVA